MARTYIIVGHVVENEKPYWGAYYKGLLSRFGVFNYINFVSGTYSFNGVEDCKRKLIVEKAKMHIVDVIEEITV